MTDYTNRWRALIQNAESHQTLDWVEAKLNRMQQMTPELVEAIDYRRTEIEAELAGRVF